MSVSNLDQKKVQCIFWTGSVHSNLQSSSAVEKKIETHGAWVVELTAITKWQFQEWKWLNGWMPNHLNANSDQSDRNFAKGSWWLVHGNLLFPPAIPTGSLDMSCDASLGGRGRRKGPDSPGCQPTSCMVGRSRTAKCCTAGVRRTLCFSYVIQSSVFASKCQLLRQKLALSLLFDLLANSGPVHFRVSTFKWQQHVRIFSNGQMQKKKAQEEERNCFPDLLMDERFVSWLLIDLLQA